MNGHTALFILWNDHAAKFEVELTSRPCQARWKSYNVYHAEGSICGDTETEQMGDLWLCEHHARRLRQWADDRDYRRRFFGDSNAEMTRMAHAASRAIDDSSVVYFVERDGFIKIGFTKRLDQRLKQLGSGSQMPDGMTIGPVELLGSMPGGRRIERMLHALFQEHRLDQSEWFYPAPELLDFIAGLACNRSVARAA